MATSTPPAAPDPMPAPEPAPAADRMPKTVKVMAVVISVLSGMVAAPVAFLLTRHYGGAPLTGIGASASGFLGAAGFVAWIEEKLHLL
ncbi:hypothetical protein OHS33_14580 [Streptomyces sp. NBC_00536]|uniref:hypothetical protein n=1 Tax=Streptomyces sp. NBC_00536 TaxID=2975769 RepID=UPI002E80CA21|nr:hypothetical protein [Streptomyces sp. NBC_00536]WUC79448.1 hypothetical protein OHS33_14580 [Streptomyces sp. NBC_00536]